MNKDSNHAAYWKENLRLLAFCLTIWLIVSFLLGIVFAGWLNQFRLFGYPLGFWFAQQGSIYTFLVLIFYYAHRMNKLDHKYHVDEAA